MEIINICISDVGDTPLGINYKDVPSNSLETIEDERFKRQNDGNTTEAPTVYRYRTYKYVIHLNTRLGNIHSFYIF